MGGFGMGTSSQKAQAVDTTNAQQKQLWKMVEQLMQPALQGATPYTGQMYVPQTGQEALYQDYINNNAGRQAALNQVLSGTVPYDISDNRADEMFEQMRAGALRDWEEVARPTISEGFAGPGYWGTARANAEMKGAQDLTQNLAETRAQLMYTNEMDARNRMDAALGRQAMYGMDSVAKEAALMLSSAQVERDTLEKKVLSEFQEFARLEPSSNPYLAIIAGFLGLSPFGIGQSGTSSEFGFSVTGPSKTG